MPAFFSWVKHIRHSLIWLVGWLMYYTLLGRTNSQTESLAILVPPVVPMANI
jgi:hypothetical protein